MSKMIRVTDFERIIEAVIPKDVINKIGVFKDMVEIVTDAGVEPVWPNPFRVSH
jgi:hypothetical protein